MHTESQNGLVWRSSHSKARMPFTRSGLTIIWVEEWIFLQTSKCLINNNHISLYFNKASLQRYQKEVEKYQICPTLPWKVPGALEKKTQKSRVTAEGTVTDPSHPAGLCHTFQNWHTQKSRREDFLHVWVYRSRQKQAFPRASSVCRSYL